MITCADSSFLISSYIRDAHSHKAVWRLAQHPNVFATELNRIEFANTVYRHVFLGSLTQSQAERTHSEFQADAARGVWVQVRLPEAVWETCIRLAKEHGPTLGVRTLDSLHVACALELRADRFWTFDERQASLAEAVGLNTAD